MPRTLLAVFYLIAIAGIPSTVAAQTFETLGTRASGLGGAFVAVADDASAVYWNPAGLASGSFFSLVVDRTSLEVKPDDPWAGSSRSGIAIALAAPPLGFGYYRLRATTTSAAALPAGESGAELRVDTLITHHAGITILQSVADSVAVGATLKVVRGIAASGFSAASNRDAILDGDDLVGKGSNTLDADLGIMASLGILRAGLTVRNLREPTFQAADSGVNLRLDRQIRAGIAFVPLQEWLMAVDVDLTRQLDPLGETRNLATGLEGRVHRRVTVRGGLRINTLGDSGRRTVVTGGSSFAVFGSTFVDAQVTGGARDGDRGWGVSGRVLF